MPSECCGGAYDTPMAAAAPREGGVVLMTPKLTEADVTKQIKGCLVALGWTGYRLQSGVVRGVTQGTYITLNPNGTPDWFFVRGSEILFVEMKAPGKKLAPAQENWFKLAEMRRTPAIWADGLLMFREKYAAIYDPWKPA